MPQHTLTVPPEQAGTRIDRVLPALLPDLSRSHGAHLLAAGAVLLNGRAARASDKVRAGDSVLLTMADPTPTALRADAIALTIVYEDDAVLVVDKPAGMVVHPAPGHAGGTLVNALLAHTDRLSLQGEIRPGIVHRLDKDTSGLLVVARTDAAHAALVRQHQARTMDKEYLGLALGQPQPPTGLIDLPLGRDAHERKRQAVRADGRAARTRYNTEQAFPAHGPVEGTTLLRLRLETGRTHQIRVHLAYIGHPILGDAVYGSRTLRAAHALGLPRHFLHATRLAFDLPGSGRRVVFDSPLPADLAAVLARLGHVDPRSDTKDHEDDGLIREERAETRNTMVLEPESDTQTIK
ncbi:MAG: RluA family pseudouridine synthase [Chloroflexota bacterium]|nr:RluA family pseudouridine synthase [Chloroflexota bacterium]